jgi:hypothetical protein
MHRNKLTPLIAAALGVATVLVWVSTNRSARPAPLLQPAALVRDGLVRAAALRSSDVSWHGGLTTARTGEQVSVFVSDSYGNGVNDVQQWADFIAGLIHGSELGLLTAYIATPNEVAALCYGDDVLGCYEANMLVAIGEPVDGVSPQEVVRHEYGHHVAANRVNAPWPAIDWGTKRWASQANVCSRATGGTAFPGDEGSEYTLNPGEAFAETYRVLNDVRGFGAAVDWTLVDSSFLPNADALQAVEQDVRQPWTGPTTSVVHGRFRARGGTMWTMSLPLPLDGFLSVDLSYPAGARDDIVLYGKTGTRALARGSPSGASSEKLTFMVCGDRSARLKVTSRGGPASFELHIARP